MCLLFFFFQAEDGIRDGRETGVQTCALPICKWLYRTGLPAADAALGRQARPVEPLAGVVIEPGGGHHGQHLEIGRASCRERVEISGGAGSFKKKKKERRGRGGGGKVSRRRTP